MLIIKQSKCNWKFSSEICSAFLRAECMPVYWLVARIDSFQWMCSYCRPQRSCEGYVFTLVCLSTGGSTWAGTPPGPGTSPPPGPGTPPRTRYTPWDQVHPPGTRYTPQNQVQYLVLGVYLVLGGTPPGPGTPPRPGTPPKTRYTPPADGYCCGRYASYWNAFLFELIIWFRVPMRPVDANCNELQA